LGRIRVVKRRKIVTSVLTRRSNVWNPACLENSWQENFVRKR
jgi:hypothetical protein